MPTDILTLALDNLLSPVILFFVLGIAAGASQSDLSIPESVAKALSLYLMLAIGFKGGVAVAEHGLDTRLIASAGWAVLLSFGMPFIAYRLVLLFTRLDRVNAAALAAHYGSISVVTFVTAIAFLGDREYEGFMVAVMAIMETPAIIAGLLMARRAGAKTDTGRSKFGVSHKLMREVFLNGSVVLLVGSFAIGMATGTEGMKQLEPVVKTPFQGALAVFLLDMGLVAARRLRESTNISFGLVGFAIVMPLIGAVFGALGGALIGLSFGGTFLFAVLGASASYIAVPAAMRLALPDADPAIYVTASLAVTFPFNITLGLPLYFILAQFFA